MVKIRDLLDVNDALLDINNALSSLQMGLNGSRVELPEGVRGKIDEARGVILAALATMDRAL